MLAQIFKGCSARAKRSTKVCALPAMAAISPRNAIPWRATAPTCAHADAAKWLSRKGEISSRGALQRLWARLRCRLCSACSRRNSDDCWPLQPLDGRVLPHGQDANETEAVFDDRLLALIFSREPWSWPTARRACCVYERYLSTCQTPRLTCGFLSGYIGVSFPMFS
jgi:hypothetical protein